MPTVTHERRELVQALQRLDKRPFTEEKVPAHWDSQHEQRMATDALITFLAETGLALTL